jgi:Ca-activated chloride channel family protein
MTASPNRVSSLLCSALLAAIAVPASANEQTMIVLDGSGSMWGQIEGRPKLEIARETLGKVLADTPAGTELGLIAYGHREKGNCKDIELVVPVAAGTGPAIASAAGRMKFLGMTPLSEAVTRAAREMRHTERKATVILITDGLETCDADPCAVGKVLEESGIDFTAHVVGFGLSAAEGKQVACLAETTGGSYFAANDASSLASALTRTVVETPKVPPPPEATLSAPESVAIASTFQVSWTGPDGQYDEVQLFDPAARGGDGALVTRQRVRTDRGHADRVVQLVAPAKPGAYSLRYFQGEHRRVLATRPIQATEAEVSLSAPDSAPIASRLRVAWVGPGANYDEVRITDANERLVTRQRVRTDKDFEARTVNLVAPAAPGDYTLEYYNGDNRKVLATRRLTVVAADVSLTAPEAAPAASRVRIGWTGPGAQYDEVRLVDAAEKLVTRQRVTTDRDFQESVATLVAPAKAGEYTLQYYNGDNRKVLASRALRVDAIEVGLDAPATSAPGTRITVGWKGPGAQYDEVRLVDAAGRIATRQRVQTDRGFDGKTVSLTAPATAGDYTLQYYNGDNRVVMAERAIAIR